MFLYWYGPISKGWLGVLFLNVVSRTRMLLFPSNASSFFVPCAKPAYMYIVKHCIQKTYYVYNTWCVWVTAANFKLSRIEYEEHWLLVLDIDHWIASRGSHTPFHLKNRGVNLHTCFLQNHSICIPSRAEIFEWISWGIFIYEKVHDIFWCKTYLWVIGFALIYCSIHFRWYYHFHSELTYMHSNEIDYFFISILKYVAAATTFLILSNIVFSNN